MPYLKAPSGANLFFHSEGRGPFLLFIHGWSVDHRIWRQQMKYFSEDYTVISVDLPGHGQSSAAKPLNLDAIARDVMDILRNQEIKSLNVVGSSFGGNVAVKLYETAPEMIKSLTLVGSMPRFYSAPDYPYGISLERKEKLLRQMFKAYPAIVHIFFRSLFTETERATRRYKWLQTFRQTDLVPAKDILIDYLILMEDINQESVIAGIKCPLLFINGTGDEICDMKTIEHMKTVFRRARFEDMPELGHFPFLSMPHEFNDILMKFLKQNQRSLSYGLWF